ncbi:hypothetical protein OH76DRAFT_739708 [Lentinus brumalis]|uniref:Uncharacterized protein n=1 Tax=Lentinus brumalis TaxID=2498619 RepID=A0A371DSA8_9APHY|nr:hypothetical protein OH76DRAFT_739708 [Polyporus brumalis]
MNLVMAQCRSIHASGLADWKPTQPTFITISNALHSRPRPPQRSGGVSSGARPSPSSHPVHLARPNLFLINAQSIYALALHQKPITVTSSPILSSCPRPRSILYTSQAFPLQPPHLPLRVVVCRSPVVSAVVVIVYSSTVIPRLCRLLPPSSFLLNRLPLPPTSAGAAAIHVA